MPSREAGWLGMIIPEEYGGSGLGVTEAAVMLYDDLRVRRRDHRAPPRSTSIVFPPMPVIKHGSEDLKRRYLPRVAHRRHHAMVVLA